MNLHICDVCNREQNKLNAARYSIKYRDVKGILKLDVCTEHRDFFKVCKSFEDADQKLTKLYTLPGINFCAK